MSDEPEWGEEFRRALAQENPEARTVVFGAAGLAEQEKQRRAAVAARVADGRCVRARILARQPTGYVSADWQGRIVQHPAAAKSYLRWTRTCLDHLRSDPKATVSITYGHPKNAAQFQAEWWEVLDHRINAASEVVVREPRDGEVALRRDQRAIHDWLKHRVRMHGLETRLVQKRLPDLAALAEEHARGT